MLTPATDHNQSPQNEQLGADDQIPSESASGEKGQFHEVANIFPLMSDAELAVLTDDIRVNGLHEPIWTYNGKIIDGRNRYRACQKAGVEPRTQEWDGNGSLLAFVLSMNLHRRHLTKTQWAMAAARIKPMFEEDARERMLAGKAADPSANLREGPEPGKASQRAAIAMGVSSRSVESAVAILRTGAPKLIAAVDAGKVRVSTAATIATLPAEVQRDVVAGGTRTIQKVASEIRSRKAVTQRKKALPPMRLDAPEPASSKEMAAQSDQTPNPRPEIPQEDFAAMQRFAEVLGSWVTSYHLSPELEKRLRNDSTFAREVQACFQRIGPALNTVWSFLSSNGFQM